MNVAKYIGLFLLKNEQCYVHGLGTLQLLRKPATYDGNKLQAASHEINIVPGGNVDDALANFIATNEQISITKASNVLKDFASATKNELQAGNQVPLPFLGEFTADDGRIGFITSQQLQYKAAPIAAKKGISMQQNERPPIPHQPYVPNNPPVSAATAAAPSMAQQTQQHQAPPQPERKERLNWARIIFVILLLIILAGAAYYGYQRYLAPQQRATKPQLTIPESIEDTDPFEEEQQDPAMADTMSAEDMAEQAAVAEQNSKQQPEENTQADKPESKPETTVKPEATTQKTEPQKPIEKPATTNGSKKLNLKVVVNTYDNKQTAYKRKRELEAQGNRAEVIEEDVNYYFVVLPVKAAPEDTAAVIRSLSKQFNPEYGVFIY